MPEVSNILAGIPLQLPEELSTCLMQQANVRIERIVSRGHASAKSEWYDQAQDEWVILMRGAATLEFAGQTELTRLQAGDYLLIPAHCRHRVEWTDPDNDSIWLAVHF
ncbi:cupin domain-containing protein [Methyloprofundus sp.]|uniref:cupin domain-containing protein n=1 Tax=Methyloprofundus sp. TaxID=2020875 RepID=UPI003D11B52B